MIRRSWDTSYHDKVRNEHESVQVSRPNRDTYLPNLSPAGHDDNDTSGPPVLEDSSGCVGRRLPLQSLHTTGEEVGITGKSAGNTPYPNTAILFESGNNEDDDIKCGR
jgi:hypothetical protein